MGHRPPRFPALAIVPAHAQRRVALAVAAIVGALAALGYALRAAPVAAAGVLAAGLGAGAYVGWCLWPRLRVGVARDLLDDLPCPPGQRVRLTFDDGPSPTATDAILDLLRQHGVRASFFVLVHKAARHPQTIARIVNEGHLLALHGGDHRVALGRSRATLRHALSHARAQLETIAGRPTPLYRPSHGWKSRALLGAVRAAGLRMVFWDYGVWDTDAPAPRVLLERLCCATPAPDSPRRPIILLHDGRDDDPADPGHAAALLTALAAWLPTICAPASADRAVPAPTTTASAATSPRARRLP